MIEYRYSYKDPVVVQKIAQTICDLRQELDRDQTRQLVIVCIGTDRSTGDSLGPLVGTFIREKLIDKLTVYGTLDEPVHALNLRECLNNIKQIKNPLIIAVDASLGREKSVGDIIIGKGSLIPGIGVNKELPKIGDIFIKGIVNIDASHFSNSFTHLILQNTRLGLVWKMANVIARGIEKAITQDRINDMYSSSYCEYAVVSCVS
jgi:putative sporulation protein YyaC